MMPLYRQLLDSGRRGSMPLWLSALSLLLPVAAVVSSEPGGGLGYSTLLGGSNNETITAVAVDNQGFVYATGLTWSDDFPATHRLSDGVVAFIAKFKPDGTGLVYASVFGGVHPRALAVDASGQVYLTGFSYGSVFPATNALQSVWNGSTTEAVLLKLSASGDRFLFATYFGGAQGADTANAIALDSSGAIWIAGVTEAPDFPVRNAFQASMQGERDAFLARFSNDGSRLEYSSYLGVPGARTAASALVLDAIGKPIVAGRTTGTLPTSANAVQTTPRGGSDAFVVRFNAAGSALEASTLLGGSLADGAGSLALDGAGNIYVRGTTSSTDFPLANPAYAGQETWGNDIFLSKLNSDLTQLLYSTYMGSWGNDTYDGWPFLWFDDTPLEIGGLTVDSQGNATIAGTTDADEFPVLRGLKMRNPAYQRDATLVQFDPQGRVIFSTYLGGRGSEVGVAVASSRAGEVYVAGVTGAGIRYPEFPTTPGALQSDRSGNGGGLDAFLAKVLVVAPTPTNDAPARASALAGSRGTQHGRIDLAAPAASNPLNPNGKTLWWRWTAPITGKLKLSTEASELETVLGLFQAGATPVLLTTNDIAGAGKTFSELRFEVSAGREYLFGVGNHGTAAGNLYLSWVVTEAPNDDFVDRLPLVGTTPSAEVTNLNTTGEDAEQLSGRTVWWKWTPPTSGVYTLSTLGSSIETVAAIFTGTPGNEFKQLFSAGPVESRRAEITWRSLAGQEYQIVLDGASGAMGTLRLTIAPTDNRPTNDDFSGAIALEGRNASSVVSDRYASSEPGDFNFAADPWNVLYSRGTTLWWRWTAPADMIRTLVATNALGQTVTNGAVRISTTGSRRVDVPGLPHDVRLAVLAGDNPTTLKAVAVADGNSNSGNPASVLLQTVQPGDTFYITTDKVAWEPSGEVQLTITVIAPPEFVNKTFRIDSGRLRGVVRGVLGSSYRVSSSSDLKTWQNLGDYVATDGQFEFEDNTTATAKYYRVVER